PGAATPIPAGLSTQLDALQHVKVARTGLRIASLGPEGGTLSTTGPDGTAYTLSLPPGALPQPTMVGLAPVTALSTLPNGANLAAGVQFEPEGLRLIVPGTLTIRSPQGHLGQAPGFVGWEGDGEHLHVPAATVADDATTFAVLHFSGLGLTPQELAIVTACAVDD